MARYTGPITNTEVDMRARPLRAEKPFVLELRRLSASSQIRDLALWVRDEFDARISGDNTFSK